MKNYQYDRTAVGLRLKAARKKKKMTQSDISSFLNCDPKHVSNFERGTVGLSIEKLLVLCNLLEVDPNYILFGTITENPNNDFLQKLNRLTSQQIQFVENCVDTFLHWNNS